MTRFNAAAILVVVTPLLAAYGRFPYSWVAGPLAALAVWAIDRKAHEPTARSAVSARL